MPRRLDPVFSRDGRQLAMSILERGQRDVWIYDWMRDTPSRLTSDPANDEAPVWMPDGRRIAFASQRGDGATYGLYLQRADGMGDAQRLTESRKTQFPGSWHPTGKFLAFTERQDRTGNDIMMLPMEGDEPMGWKAGKPTAFLSTPANEGAPMFSPDGRWLAYSSNESGGYEVYVRPFPGPGGTWQISTGAGTAPIWSRSRRELFYGTPDRRIMVASYAVEGDAFRAEKPRLNPVVVGSLAASRRQTVQDGCLGVFEIRPPGSARTGLAGLFLRDFDLDIDNGLLRRCRQRHRLVLPAAFSRTYKPER